jgi:acyl-CoA thioester hydrolase
MVDAELRVLARQELPEALRSVGAPVFAAAHVVRADETSALVPHANNIVILGWIDRIASLHGAAAGAAREDLARQGRMWFVARHEVDYLGESFAGDEVIVATWVESIGRTSLMRATRIARMADGKELVRAMSRWALVDLATRRPVAMPEATRAAFIVA